MHTMEEIKAKGFNIMAGAANTNYNQPTGYSGYSGIPNLSFNKLKIGAKTVEDAILKFGTLKKVNPRLADKENVLRAIDTYDLKTMREISNFFYKTSGIYARIIRYMAFMYRYDWFLTPFVNDDKAKSEKVLKGYYEGLNILDRFGVKKVLGEIALQVLLQGVYYGYKVKTKDGIVLQDLPVDYCRTRLNQGHKSVVEFNMRYFDDCFRDTTTKMKILKVFPKEFSEGYILYKKGKLPPEFQGDTSGWFTLEPDNTVRFTANGEEYPAFISVIPLIIDLDAAQEMDRKKTMQRLLKLVIQKMPLDKNGELIFDVDEAQQLHNNAVEMLSRAIGVDVLTTFADVEVASMDASKAETQSDDLIRVERQLFNEAGVSQMQFNTDGNIALEKSILNDEATLYNMLLQFDQFLNELLDPINTSRKKIEYRVQLLTTTIYNYKELAKLYKEQTQLGYSKFLPQIALGQSQSSILANAYFENDVLDLVNVFIPPLMSSTMNGDVLNRVKGDQANPGNKSNPALDPNKGEPGAGRKELPDDQKSEKTIKNRESMS